MKNFTQKFIGILAIVSIMTANLFAQTPGQFCTINLGSIVGDVYGTYDCGGNCVGGGADISACVFFQYDINAAYNLGYSDGEASVTPDDGVNQSDVDGAYFIGFSQGAASVIPEDGIGQEDVDAAFADGVASVEITECEEISTQNIPLYLSEGWSIFGYTCLEPIDAIDGLIEIVDNILIVKDYLGNAYLPEWNFNGIGSFEFARGYQIKMLEEVTGFQFCPAIITVGDVELGCTDEIAFNYNPLATEPDGSCYPVVYGCMNPNAFNFNDYDNDGDGDYITGINGVDVNTDNGTCIPIVNGCTEINAVNFNQFANMDDGSCVEVVYGCTGPDHCNYNPEANIDDGSCIYPQEGYDCDGNIIEYVVGMEAEGGIVFYVDETGEHGLVAATEDIGEFEWGCYGTSISGAFEQAIGTGYQNTMDIVNQGCTTENDGITAAQAALAYESGGYNDWYLPSLNELFDEMYNTIGQGGPEGNIGGFSSSYYWSSSESTNLNAWGVGFNNGLTGSHNKYNTYRVRVIRAF